MRKSTKNKGLNQAVKQIFQLNLLRQALFALLIMQISRLIWAAGNMKLLSDADFFTLGKAVLWGTFFDLPVLAYFFLPLWFWMIVFTSFHRRLPAVAKVLFTLSAFAVLILNGIDTAYSQVTGRRSGIELFSTLADPANPVAGYLLAYWFVIVGLAAVCYLIYICVPVHGSDLPFSPKENWMSIFKPLIVCCIWLVCARGGFHLKPMTSLHAGMYVPASVISLTTSTPLQIISSQNGDPVPDINFMKLELAMNIVQPEFRINPNAARKKQNVILIIVESLGRDYTGFLNNKPYTPFLDTFSKNCLNFRYCYANGTRSIEMVPSIFCGMPSMIESHYINGSYATNKINNAFDCFASQGYQTAFFHGANNGTMSFQSFLKQTGPSHYFGLNEYPKVEYERDFDGAWGIFDEPYFKYFLRCCDTMNKPFFNAVFTLSSHDPYQVPPQYKSQCPNGTLPIHRSIRYTDLALKSFFAEARKYEWFNETIFVITGDHTSYGEDDYFYSSSGHYEIPLLFYGNNIQPGIVDKTVSQCDIVPTLMAMTGISQPFFGFGKNALDSAYQGYSIHKEKGLYYIVRYPYSLGIDAEGAVKDFHSQPRNHKRHKNLPHSGPVYEELKSLMQAHLALFSHCVKQNKWSIGRVGNHKN